MTTTQSATPATPSAPIALAIAIIAAALALAACGGAEPQFHIFNLATTHGKLASGNDAFVVNQGDDVAFNVSSDSPGVFHIHGYDLRARVEAGGSGQIKFDAGATGRFEIAFHPADAAHHMTDMDGMTGEPDIVIAWLEVQPG